jgi:hypothetical protein
MRYPTSLLDKIEILIGSSELKAVELLTILLGIPELIPIFMGLGNALRSSSLFFQKLITLLFKGWASSVIHGPSSISGR